MDILKKSIFITSLLGFIVMILDLGFNQDDALQKAIHTFYWVVLVLGLLTSIIRVFSRLYRYVFWVEAMGTAVLLFDLFLGAWILLALLSDYSLSNQFLESKGWTYLLISIYFVREFSDQKIKIVRSYINPAQLFILSFLLIIAIGTLLLMLPNATHGDIKLIDAFFTSTSAVCVTGLIVQDTSAFFTGFGQSIILILIQVGGLGILTFASYFSYFFKGGSTFENQIMLRDITQSKMLNEVFTSLKKIIVITLSIEIIGAFIIMLTVLPNFEGEISKMIFFSVFHAVSGFCNAGFSNLSEGLYTSGFRFNYTMQLAIIFLFVLGGLGFPIVLNLLTSIKYWFKKYIIRSPNIEHKPWILNLNTRITLITSFLLVFFGTIVYFVFEYHYSLADHRGFGKFITALFGACTPRTAGFNTVDMSSLQLPVVVLMIVLMWIGASPASTGGGIKTSTFAIAFLNFVSLAKGKNKIEIYKREIADISIRRAFAIIVLSFLVIGFAAICIGMAEPELELVSIIFECFSAYSTVGLTLGITQELSSFSKVILIFTMFIGRVGMLSLLIALFKKVKQNSLRYPVEEIIIN